MKSTRRLHLSRGDGGLMVGVLRPVLALAIYIGCICGFGLLGMLPISRNMVLHPDGAGGIAPLLHILAVARGIWGALVWRHWLQVERAATGRPVFQNAASTIALFVLIYGVCAFAFLRGAPFGSTYLWGAQQSLEVRVDYVKPARTRGTCSNKLFFGIGQRDYVVALKDFGWPNRFLCVNGYDDLALGPSMKPIAAPWITMTGQGNWLAFRMEHYWAK